EHIGFARVEDELQCVVAVARGLGGVERRAAADHGDASLGEPTVGRYLGQPLGLHGDRLPRQVSCHTALYTMTGDGGLRALRAGERPAGPDLADATRAIRVVRRDAGGRL